MTPEAPDHDDHDHDLGLAHDLSTLMERRKALKLFAGAGLLALVGCSSSKAASSAAPSSSTASTTASTTAAPAATTSTSAATTTTSAAAAAAGGSTSAAATPTSSAITAAVPEETAGPFPGDGSNGKNVLNQSGIVRRDIRSSFGTSTTTAGGVPFTIKLQIVKAGSGAPLAGAAVYVWHCDIDGRYSMYSNGVTDENYLRGVQEADANGNVTFTSIFPGCYSGRWPHVHYEVYPSLSEATASGSILATSQLALPEDACKLAYAATGYGQSVTNLSRITLATDNVFSDGTTGELPTVTGSPTAGFVSNLVAPVNA